jgi:hypothetical protein
VSHENKDEAGAATDLPDQPQDGLDILCHEAIRAALELPAAVSS